MAFLASGTREFLPLWLKLILSGHPFLSTMPIYKEQHDELCTCYAALALHDGDVSYFQLPFFTFSKADSGRCCLLLRPRCRHPPLTNDDIYSWLLA